MWFNRVCTWTHISPVLWLMCDMRILCILIKYAQSANNNASLTHNANANIAVRQPIAAMLRYVHFAHFLPQFQHHTTGPSFQDLVNRLGNNNKGYLNRELRDKAKTMYEQLTVWDFRFLIMVTGKEVVKAQCHTPLDQQAQERDIALFLGMLTGDVTLLFACRRLQQDWEPNHRAQKRIDDQTQEADINNVVEELCSTCAPIATKTEGAVIPFVCESITTWAETESLSQFNSYTIFLVRFDVLGPTYHANMIPTFPLVSAYISNNPGNSGTIVIASNTGNDEHYHDRPIDAAIQEVYYTMREDIYIYCFWARRGPLSLDEESFGPRSKSPGHVIAWMVASDAKYPDNPNKFASVFETSSLFKRRRSLEDLKVFASCLVREPLLFALVRASQGAQGLSKAQRPNQRHTGVPSLDWHQGAGPQSYWVARYVIVVVVLVVVTIR